ncbi:MAG: SusD/RagB family nutrient-binding outer membrane lipoprotein [Cyclobacteriaceae bacterium]|nr:SusD/RagB family nutrient-binding outer membrane lipoprotein [Cyclobacteriaceae bacterium]
MKNLKIYFIVLAIVVIVMGGCTEKFDEINTDPLALTADKVNASLIGLAFAQTQYNTVNGVHWRFQISQNLFSDLYCQYFATTQSNFDSDRYTQVGRWSDLCWSSFYGEAAPNIKFVEDFTAENGFDVQNAVAKVWRVYGYHRITDYYGPVPYSEFGNGETSVAYDSQEEMYRSFFTTLNEAIDVLKANANGNAFGSNDQIYSGDVGLWIKFANTLKLRLAMRVKYVDAALAKKNAEEAVAGGVIEDNSENATMLTTSNSPNPINTITNWGEYRMSAAMESVLKGFDDPRMPTYFSPAVDGDSDGDGIPYEGLRNGQSKIDLTNNKNNNHSDLGTNFLPPNINNNPRIVVIRAGEAYLLRAEGALEGWNMGGSAQALYEEGISQSIMEWTAADAAKINAYINSSNTPVPTGDVHGTPALSDIPVKYEGGASKERQLEQIITQKWLALYPDGWEAWAELRRTGYPKQYDRLNSDNPDVGVGDIMRRMVYVTSEFNNNPDAVEAAIASPEIGGADKGSTKLWWDKK